MNIKECVVCGNRFENTAKYERKTCSKECNYQLVANKTKERAVEEEQRHCEVCAKAFNIKPYKKDRTCSKECKARLIAKKLSGKQKTEQHRQNLSKSMKNSEANRRTRFKKGKDNPAYGRNQTGPANHNWKGGITNVNQKRRNDPRLLEWRKLVFERDNFTCQKCGTRGYLQAHHIIPFSKDFSKAFDVENGLTVCITCHEKIHGRFIGKFKQNS